MVVVVGYKSAHTQATPRLEPDMKDGNKKSRSGISRAAFTKL